jgi:amidophosphoribosyltransferase
MIGEVHEECAVAGVYLRPGATAVPGGATAAVYALLSAQTNRGDLSSGIARYNPASHHLLDVLRGKGTPPELFGKPGSRQLGEFFNAYEGPAAIGHNRYATSGENVDPKAVEYSSQPFFREHDKRCKEFAFCFNGNLPNYAELRACLRGETENYHFKTATDTELIKIYFSRFLQNFNRKLTDDEYAAMFADLGGRFDGAYNLCFLDANGTLICSRDPIGFRPLVWADDDRLFACASESSALRYLGLEEIHAVGPGEMLIVDESGVRSRRFAQPRNVSRCAFEAIYFMKSGSRFDEVSVQKARERIGYELALVETLRTDESTVIAPVPKTGIPIRTGYVNGLLERGFRFRLVDALILEDYGRTFIDDFGEQDRMAKIRNKFDMTPGYLVGKDLILLDDSIVRGNTARMLIRYLREHGGARSVHLRVGAPPNRFPCFYGINMPTRTELVAAGRDVEEVRKELEVDSLVYITQEALLRALRAPQVHLDREADGSELGFCLGCFSGSYPTPWGNRLLDQILAQEGTGGPHCDP